MRIAQETNLLYTNIRQMMTNRTRRFKVLTHIKQRDSTEKPEPINMGPDFFLDAKGQDESDNESANDDTESQRSSSESEDSHTEQDPSENSGDDSSPPPSPSDDEHEEWE